MLALDYEDILFLWKLQEKIIDDEISFSYTDFSFFKEVFLHISQISHKSHICNLFRKEAKTRH